MPSSPHNNILPTHTPALFDAAVVRASALLRAGEVIALPTETVYGLAANAFNAEAVRRIYGIKGRPAHNPIIVHVASIEMAKACAQSWPAAAEKSAAAFWPGPLTIILPRSSQIPSIVTAGGETVGIRWPSHPFIQAVIRACGFPLAAPSANPANQVSPTNAEHVSRSLGDLVPLIVDGGQSQVGIESTVVDLSVEPARVLRPGMIHDESLAAVLGELGGNQPFPAKPMGTLRSPGLLAKHYSPKARLLLSRWENEADLNAQISKTGTPPARVHIIAHTRIPFSSGLGGVSVIPHDAEAFARAIYAELHRCDEAGAELIIVELPPEGAEWRAIADRLRRAAA
jgi:L-threonylcarbamoyladenylate synthase